MGVVGNDNASQCGKDSCSFPCWKGFFIIGGNMKKTWKVLSLLAMSLLFFGCSTNTTNNQHLEIEVSLTVSGVVEQELTTSDFNDMEWTELEITRVSKDVETIVAAKGVLLTEVLDYLNISEFATITVIAADDYSQEYDEEVALDSQTILVFFDGDSLIEEDDGPIWLLAGNFANNLSIKQLKEIVVE